MNRLIPESARLSAEEGARTSQILENVLPAEGAPDPTLGEVLRKLDDRAFGLTMLILVAPNCIPFPPLPVLSSITGVPLMLIALQFAFGRHTIWLPRRYAEKTVSRPALARMVRILKPKIEWLERGVKPRWPMFTNALGDRFVGAGIAFLALVMSLPIVMGNFPPAVAILVMALGLIESDGRTIFLGAVLGVLATLWVALVAFVGVEIVLVLFPWARDWLPFLP